MCKKCESGSFCIFKNMHEAQGTKIHLDSKSLHLVEAPDQKVEVVNHPQHSQLFDCVVVGAGAEIAKELGYTLVSM